MREIVYRVLATFFYTCGYVVGYVKGTIQKFKN